MNAIPATDARALKRLAAEAREWMFEAAFPFWSERGVDRAAGAYFDLLTLDGEPVAAPKRTFVQARQVSVFADAAALGWSGPWEQAIEIGLNAIATRCRHPQGGVVHSIAPGGEPHEVRRDLYDQAFVALAYAKAAQALDRADHAARARDVFDALDANWRLAPAGYAEGELYDGPHRRQNPHMHLFEAAIALASTPHALPADLARAREMARWFREHFYQPDPGALIEYFDAHWRPAPGEDGAIVEPGHCFEWAWLLQRYEALSGDDMGVEIEGLWAFARKHGLDERRNLAIDEVTTAGAVRSARARLWPQTERLKAALACFERKPAFGAEEAQRAFAGLQTYMMAARPAMFYDKQNADGSFIDEPVRASSMYHIVTAYAELNRIASRV